MRSEEFCGSSCSIPLGKRNAAENADIFGSVGFDGYAVVNGNRVHDAAELMIAVITLSEYLEGQVNFGRGKKLRTIFGFFSDHIHIMNTTAPFCQDYSS